MPSIGCSVGASWKRMIGKTSVFCHSWPKTNAGGSPALGHWLCRPRPAVSIESPSISTPSTTDLEAFERSVAVWGSWRRWLAWLTALWLGSRWSRPVEPRSARSSPEGGDQPANVEAGSLWAIDPPVLNDGGQLAFMSSLLEAPSNRRHALGWESGWERPRVVKAPRRPTPDIKRAPTETVHALRIKRLNGGGTLPGVDGSRGFSQDPELSSLAAGATKASSSDSRT